jgi:hypothetical protein
MIGCAPTVGTELATQLLVAAHFALPPGNYRVEVRSSSGAIQAKELVVDAIPLRAKINLD